MSLLFLIALLLFIVGAFWSAPRVNLIALGLAFTILWLAWPQALPL